LPVVNGDPVADENYMLSPGVRLDFVKDDGFKGLGDLLTPAEIQGRWKITEDQYRELLKLHLPAIELKGETRHPEEAVDEWCRRMGWLTEGRIASPQSLAPVPMAPPSRLLIDPNNLRAVLDGDPYPLKSHEQGVALQVIVDARGNWVSGPEMGGANPVLEDIRVDRLINDLPGPIEALIERRRGKGFRLRMA